MIYTLIFERLPLSTLLIDGAPLPPPEQMPPANEWITVTTAPVELDKSITVDDVINLKDQIANLVVFQKTPARLRITWTEPGGKIAGTRFENPRELIMFDDFTFAAARQHLLDSLEIARAAVEAEPEPTPPIIMMSK